ncbi:Uncharacterized protein APZ42_015410 [Daphnia magna]|uniref:Uncharacterized protein n=1 Tax=Daphnia magna TaxID=35525 RepID=A0A162PG99_9CRUS|nr:Uncharacterized protein APZ42_015410 [Daphnia magna]
MIVRMRVPKIFLFQIPPVKKRKKEKQTNDKKESVPISRSLPSFGRSLAPLPSLSAKHEKRR